MATTASAKAQEGPQAPEFHGYATQGFAISDHNNYYDVRTNRGSARLTEVALNISEALSERLRIVTQLSAVLSDVHPDVNLKLDFGFADYRVADYFGVRVGRFRNLTSLYSEVWDTDIARTPMYLPGSVYDPDGRNFTLASNGVQLYGNVGLGSAGGLVYAGAVGSMPSFGLDNQVIDVKWTASGRLIYETPVSGLRVGGAFTLSEFALGINMGSAAAAQLVAAGLAPPDFDGNVVLDGKGGDRYRQVYAFAEYVGEKLTLAAEYSRANANPKAPEALQAVIPPNPLRQDGFYGLASYRVVDWFTVGGYASFYYGDYKNRDTSVAALHQFDYALTTRFDLNSYLAFKLEGHYIDGTAQLNGALNQGSVSDNGFVFASRISAAF